MIMSIAIFSKMSGGYQGSKASILKIGVVR